MNQRAMKNFLTVILTELKVEFTHKFADKLYRENPDRDNFFGLTCMLSFYGIECKGYYVEKKKLEDVQPPFVAQTNSGFMMVKSTNTDSVVCVDQKAHRSIPSKLFIDSWTGNVLMIKKRDDSVEIEYSTHKSSERIDKLKAASLYTSVASIAIGIVLFRLPLLTASKLVYLVLCLLGIGVSSILLARQWNSGVSVGEKICDFFGKGGCDAVASSPASRVFFGISWSEIGVAYFLSTFILLVLFPNTYIALGVINLFTLPYTMWSIWYQAFKVRRICPLCLAVLIILWGLFIVFYFSNQTKCTLSPRYLLTIPFYVAVILALHFYSAKIDTIFRQEELINSYRSILCRREVVSLLQKNSPLIAINNEDSSIFMGNSLANNKVTIIANPFCVPCAHVIKVMEQILKINKDVSVRYIFVSHSKESHAASLYLLNSYHIFGETAINEWFNLTKQGKKEKLVSVNDMESDTYTENEMQHHKAFCERNNIRWTPTITIVR